MKIREYRERLRRVKEYGDITNKWYWAIVNIEIFKERIVEMYAKMQINHAVPVRLPWTATQKKDP